ncbi:MAG TPA: glucose-6-phosphate dehydrogenase [Methylotenera sp.]|nr:glucose-6-phosphate dehydrogenase [Methylotenera sp.]HPV43936.1 glucose-6-phosphate dehydrogenase [Methylotenera sp.]
MKKIDPCTLVLFGASGNLSRIKLMPGLFKLHKLGRLSDGMKILSVGRGEMSRAAWHAEIKGMMDAKYRDGYDHEAFAQFLERNHYHANPPTNPDAFKKMAATLGDEKVFPQNLAYFLSVRPSDFAEVVEKLSGVGLLDESKYWRRVLVEKPFGTDLATAQDLQAKLTKHLKESQIYRIDHYLGKAAVQNAMLFRFTNSIFEAFWNKDYIDHVQITNNEILGVGERTTFYDATGALRDMFQSHLLQTLAMVSMEKPADLKPENVRAAKIKLLQSIRPIDAKNINKQAFRAQYAAGRVCVGDGHGENVPGYQDELKRDNMPPSNTETYAAVKLFIDNPRWQGVPFYVRTGKRMHEGNTAISIRFKKAPMMLTEHQHHNWLIVNIQPRECLKFEIESKVPSLDVKTRTMSIDLAQRVAGDDSVDSYETLLLNLMEGDPSQFLHIDEVEAQWKLVDPIVKAWAEDKGPVHQYRAGHRDPEESSIIFESQDQFWRYSIELGGDKH